MTSKVVFVTPQLPIAYANGGIGTFVDHFARLLHQDGHQVTLILTSAPEQPSSKWMPPYTTLSMTVHTILEYHQALSLYPAYPHDVAVSELVSQLIPEDTDVVYLADWKANGLHLVRSRRFTDHARKPIIVNIAHGNSEWHREGQQYWPSHYHELALDYCERYAIEHSDFVICPSAYMHRWLEKTGWRLPAPEFVRTLGYPFIPPTTRQTDPTPRTPPAPKFTRIVFFGRIETRKGFDLFVKALLSLEGEDCLQAVEEIVFLGQPSVHLYGTPEVAATLITEVLDIPVVGYYKHSSTEAQAYLREHSSDTLVVVPSRLETMGFTIIESSTIPGLNLICSNAGGMPDALGGCPDSDQLFPPTVKGLRKALMAWLDHGPRPSAELCHYDWQAANQRWLAFHAEAVTVARTSPIAPQPPVLSRAPSAKSADVCIPFYNLGAYLPALLTSLENQTTDDFNVIVVNDGSTDPDSIRVFKAMSQKYSGRGWQFIDQPNNGVCRARNHAAARGQAPYLIWMDADNIAEKTMVARFIESMDHSGDDCLTCYLWAFAGDVLQRIGSRLLPPLFTYIPVGNAPELNFLENPYGDANCIMRRTAFEAIGGFTTNYPNEVNQEDRELLTRLSLAGYKLDVIPEFLFYYRVRKDSRLRSTEHFQNEGRVMSAYKDLLAPLGLERIVPLLLGLKYRAAENNSTAQLMSNAMLNPADQVDYLVNRVRWSLLLRAMLGKAGKNLRRRKR